MTESTSHYFDTRIAFLQKESSSLEKRANALSWIRVATFVAFLVAIIYFANAREFQSMIFSFIAFVPLFGIIVQKHNRAKFALAQHQHLIAINQDELKRRAGSFSDLDDGSEYLNTNHAYAPDLDLFGSNSLFQLLVRTKLSGTREIIKNWLLQKSTKQEIEERQEAIKELATDTEWRQELTAYGCHGRTKSQQNGHMVVSLLQWIDKNVSPIDKPIWHVFRFLMPVVSLTILTGISFLGLAYQWIYLPVLINMALLSVIFKPLLDLTKEFGNMASFLKGYENVIQQMENKEFSSTLLVGLQNQLQASDVCASQSIKSLRRILMFLLNRVNLMYPPFNILFLLDVNWLLMAIQWKKKNISHVEQWFDAVHEIDAISDLASFTFANPEFVFPDLSDKSHYLKTKSLAHPLIKPKQRVANDFELREKGTLGLITGSNMSGKSTFLRTVGVNLVLAQMGGPVCAKQFEFSLVQIYTSMRTQDNLEENVSSFYAELKRLKSLLDLLQKDEPVFYMLDEILKGTNSDDRHKGAMSLIEQLIHLNCRGLISTHDIQLATLSKEHTNLENMSFNSTIVDDEIIFDYKLSLEPCKSFNASKLMEKMGIIKK